MSYTIPEGIQAKADAVIAVASVIADEDKSALGDGSVNTALDVLADVLAGQDVEVPQTNAGAILALADYVGGGGGAQSYPITVTGDAGAYIFDGQGYPTVQITERAAGEYVVIKADKPLSSENTGVFGDTVDIVPVSFNYDPDDDKRAYFIMPAGATYITVS